MVSIDKNQVLTTDSLDAVDKTTVDKSRTVIPITFTKDRTIIMLEEVIVTLKEDEDQDHEEVQLNLVPEKELIRIKRITIILHLILGIVIGAAVVNFFANI